MSMPARRRSIGAGGGGGGAGAAAGGAAARPAPGAPPGAPPSRPAPGPPAPGAPPPAAPRPSPRPAPRPAPPPPPPRPAFAGAGGGITTPASTHGDWAVPSPLRQPITVCVCSVDAGAWAATIAVAAQMAATPPSTASFIVFSLYVRSVRLQADVQRPKH